MTPNTESNNKAELPLIDINVEAKHVESLIDSYYVHHLPKNEIANLFKKINYFLDTHYRHLLLQGNYKSGFSDLIHDRLEEIISIYINDKINNRDGFFEDKEYNWFRTFSLNGKEISRNVDYDNVIKKLKKELKEDIEVFKQFTFHENPSKIAYQGFDSGGATHPGVHVLLEKSYTEYRLDRHGGKLHNHILENLLTHMIGIHIMNNDILMRDQIKDYLKSQTRDPNTGVILHDDESLLKEPYLKYLLEISSGDLEKPQIEKLTKDYIKQKGMFKPNFHSDEPSSPTLSSPKVKRI